MIHQYTKQSGKFEQENGFIKLAKSNYAEGLFRTIKQEKHQRKTDAFWKVCKVLKEEG